MDCLEAGLDTHIQVSDAIDFAIKAWDNVTEDCIRNCWIKTNIVPLPMASELRSSNHYKKKSVSNDFEELAYLMGELGIESSVEEYLAIEDEEEIHAPVENNELHSESNESSDEDTEIQPISYSEALKSCLILSSYFQHRADCDAEKKKVEQLLESVRQRKVCKQSRLDVFFTNS